MKILSYDSATLVPMAVHPIRRFDVKLEHLGKHFNLLCEATCDTYLDPVSNPPFEPPEESDKAHIDFVLQRLVNPRITTGGLVTHQQGFPPLMPLGALG